MLDIKIQKTAAPKAKPAAGQKLGFGKIFTDHMFVMNYTEGKGWHDPRVVPYENISLAPSAMICGSLPKIWAPQMLPSLFRSRAALFLSL